MKPPCVILATALLISIPLSLWSQGAPNGIEIYKTRCASCHSAKGEGLPNVRIPAVKGTSLTAAQIVALITTGQGGKTVHASPIVNINKEEAKAVAECVKSLK